MSSINPRDPALKQIEHTNTIVSLSVIVPVYNSEDSLPVLVQRMEPVLITLATEFELILVNDGSCDRSWQVVEELTMRYKWVKGINLLRNYGQHNALLCGIRAAIYDVVVTMDDDLQQRPEDICHLVTKLEEGYDVVYGTPLTIQQSYWRGLASQLTRLALRSVMHNEIARQASSFRAFYTPLRDAFTNYSSPSVSIDVLLTWGATHYAAIPVPYDPRNMGFSTYTFGKLIGHALDMLTGFSTLPLLITSIVGFAFTIFGMIVLFYVLGVYLIHGGSIPGFPFLASVIAIFSGAILFALGIIGAYLSRIFVQSMGQPPYFIRSISDKG
jgi:undecaprenyl-phosphate 4-deoxy-4-formamido-L-arabinose transferase